MIPDGLTGITAGHRIFGADQRESNVYQIGPDIVTSTCFSFPLTAGFRGVLVKNADDQLVENVKDAMNQNPDLKIYFAKGDFKGLRGYYTSGVIEGAYHYGVFDSDI